MQDETIIAAHKQSVEQCPKAVLSLLPCNSGTLVPAQIQWHGRALLHELASMLSPSQAAPVALGASGDTVMAQTSPLHRTGLLGDTQTLKPRADLEVVDQGPVHEAPHVHAVPDSPLNLWNVGFQPQRPPVTRRVRNACLCDVDRHVQRTHALQPLRVARALSLSESVMPIPVMGAAACSALLQGSPCVSLSLCAAVLCIPRLHWRLHRATLGSPQVSL